MIALTTLFLTLTISRPRLHFQLFFTCMKRTIGNPLFSLNARNMVVIAGFGNPLLDITVKIPNRTLLDKYNLNEDDSKEIPADKIKSLLDDISSLNPSITPGGAAQNTMRILQWVLGKLNSIVMFGAVGQDALGDNLKALIEASGVKTRYIQHANEPTGTVVALVSGASRSLVAYIGAAQHVTIADLHAEDIKILSSAHLVYMEGFFLPERKQVAKYIQEFCYDSQIIFTFNLSAVYMARNFSDDILYFANNCDILIGNYREYEALIEAAKIKMDPKSLIAQLSANHDNSKNLKYGKIVIMTNGSKSVLCAHSNGKIEEIAVPKIESDKIADTTGAGDAFAAGFLAGMFNGRSPVGCLKWGCWVAQQIIQQIGCTIPNYSAESLRKIS